MKSLADVLMKRRIAKLRQRQVAERVGWNDCTLVDIERGKLPVGQEVIDRIDAAIDQLVAEKHELEEVKS